MAVAFEAVSPVGQNAATANTVTATWTHPSGAANRVIIAAYVARIAGVGSAGQTRTITCGGAAMTSLGIVAIGTELFAEILIATLQPSTAQTISVALASGSVTGRTLIGASSSFIGVSRAAAAVSSSGTGTALTQTGVASSPGNRIVQVFGQYNTNQSAYTQTQRANQLTSDFLCDILLGDAPGAAAVNFASTGSGSQVWGGLAVDLQALRPPPPSLNQAVNRGASF